MTTQGAPTVRLAVSSDASAIARIYNQGIAERLATFETEPRSAEQIAAGLAEKGDRYPTVVVEHDGILVAWASAGPYRARPAYWTERGSTAVGSGLQGS